MRTGAEMRAAGPAPFAGAPRSRSGRVDKCDDSIAPAVGQELELGMYLLSPIFLLSAWSLFGNHLMARPGYFRSQSGRVAPVKVDRCDTGISCIVFSLP